jgi:hypothetical protein
MLKSTSTKGVLIIDNCAHAGGDASACPIGAAATVRIGLA